MRDVITYEDMLRAAKMLGADELETVARRHMREAIYCAFSCYGCMCIALWTASNREVSA